MQRRATAEQYCQAETCTADIVCTRSAQPCFQKSPKPDAALASRLVGAHFVSPMIHAESYQLCITVARKRGQQQQGALVSTDLFITQYPSLCGCSHNKWQHAHHLYTTEAIHSVAGSTKVPRCTIPSRSVSASARACHFPSQLKFTVPMNSMPGGSPERYSAAIQGPTTRYRLYRTYTW